MIRTQKEIVLGIIEDGVVTARAIAERGKIDYNVVHQVLNTLNRKGYIRKDGFTKGPNNRGIIRWRFVKHIEDKPPVARKTPKEIRLTDKEWALISHNAGHCRSFSHAISKLIESNRLFSEYKRSRI